MVALASGMLHSKPVCRLRTQDRQRLAELVVQAFQRSRRQGDDGSVSEES